MYNGKEIRKVLKKNAEPAKRPDPYGKNVSEYGYRDDSPYRDSPYLNIFTPDGTIDMSNTGIPLMANNRYLPAYSGMHQFKPGFVKETKIAKEGISMVSLNNLAPTQNLAKKDKNIVANIKNAISRGEFIEPLSVKKSGENYKIKDGHHRYLAYKELGINNVPVNTAAYGGDPSLPYLEQAQDGRVKSYNPNLANQDIQFQNWYSKNTVEGQQGVPYSDKQKYDYYSFFKSGKNGNIQNHFPDTFKRPSHDTFSDESIYSTPENPRGHWFGDIYNSPINKVKGKFVYGGGLDEYQDGGKTYQAKTMNEFNSLNKSYSDSLMMHNEAKKLHEYKIKDKQDTSDILKYFTAKEKGKRTSDFYDKNMDGHNGEKINDKELYAIWYKQDLEQAKKNPTEKSCFGCEQGHKVSYLRGQTGIEPVGNYGYHDLYYAKPSTKILPPYKREQFWSPGNQNQYYDSFKIADDNSQYTASSENEYIDKNTGRRITPGKSFTKDGKYSPSFIENIQEPLVSKSYGGWLDELPMAQEGSTVNEESKQFLKDMANSPLFNERYARMTGQQLPVPYANTKDGHDQNLYYPAEQYKKDIINNLNTVKYAPVGEGDFSKRSDELTPAAYYQLPTLGVDPELQFAEKVLKDKGFKKRQPESYEFFQKKADEIKEQKKKEHTIFINKGQETSNLHETSHASTLGTLSFAKDYPYIIDPQLNQEGVDRYTKHKRYYSTPTEIKARVDVTRKGLKDAGLYDATKAPFTEKDYNNLEKYQDYLFYDSSGKFKADDKSMHSNEQLHDIKSTHSKEDFIRMMNDIVSNKPNQQQPTAEFGGETDEYRTGGGWLDELQSGGDWDENFQRPGPVADNTTPVTTTSFSPKVSKEFIQENVTPYSYQRPSIRTFKDFKGKRSIPAADYNDYMQYKFYSDRNDLESAEDIYQSRDWEDDILKSGWLKSSETDAYTKLDRLDDVFYDKSKENQYYIPSDKQIKLTQGRYNLGKINTGLIDEVVKKAKEYGVDPLDILSIAGRESTFGQPYGKTSTRPVNDLTEVFSAWANSEKNASNFYDYFGKKKHPGLELIKNSSGWSYRPKDHNSIKGQFTQENVDEYLKYREENEKTRSKDNALDFVAKKIKNKELHKYNPGDPDYQNKLANEKKLLSQETELMKYLGTREFGGEAEDEYRKGGPVNPLQLSRNKRRKTSKNIQSSINELFLRNYTLYGPGGRNIYDPKSKFETGGGWLDNYQDGGLRATSTSAAIPVSTQAPVNSTGPTNWDWVKHKWNTRDQGPSDWNFAMMDKSGAYVDSGVDPFTAFLSAPQQVIKTVNTTLPKAVKAIGEKFKSLKGLPNGANTKAIVSSVDDVGNLANQFRKNPLSEKELEMYKWFKDKLRFDKLPKTTNKESLSVLEDFKTRIQTPEGKKRMKELGIDNDKMLQKLEIVEDPNTFGYYTGYKNKIVMNPQHPLPKKVVRHEIEHGVQNAMSSSKIDKVNYDSGNFKYLFNPKKGTQAKFDALKPTSEIDDLLSGLELRREGTPNKVWNTEMQDSPVNIDEYKSAILNKQNATDYFLTGSTGKEKSAFLGEVQQYMMDAGTIPKKGYVEITPEMVKNTMVDAMFDEKQGGKFLRLFNIMKASDTNYDLVAKGLNKMLGLVPVGLGVGAAASQEQRYGGQQRGWLDELY